MIFIAWARLTEYVSVGPIVSCVEAGSAADAPRAPISHTEQSAAIVAVFVNRSGIWNFTLVSSVLLRDSSRTEAYAHGA
jgi:hypothetical protein